MANRNSGHRRSIEFGRETSCDIDQSMTYFPGLNRTVPVMENTILVATVDPFFIVHSHGSSKCSFIRIRARPGN